MSVGDTILDAEAESGIDENWYLLDNQSICNAFINGQYMSNIRDEPDGQYLFSLCNAGLTYTNNICDLPGYSNPVCYNPKGLANILSLWLVQKHHLVNYNSQYGNEFIIRIPQRPTLRWTRLLSHTLTWGIFSKNKKNAHIVVNDSHFPTPEVE